MKRKGQFETSRRAAKALRKIRRIQVRDNTTILPSPPASPEITPPASPPSSLETYKTQGSNQPTQQTTRFEERTLNKRESQYLQILVERDVLGDTTLAVEQPELVDRARRALAQALATSTINANTSAWTCWKKWCQKNNLNSTKPKESELTLFVFEKGTALKKYGGLTYATIKNYLYGIGHYLSAGSKAVNLLEEMPMLDRMVQLIRSIQGPTNPDQRQPNYWWMLRAIQQSSYIKTVTDRNMIAMAFLGREGLYRLGELAPVDKTTTQYLRTSQWQSTASQGMATLTLLQGKSVQWRQPIDVIHPIEDNPGCAAKLINELISNRQAPCATDPLFQDSKGRPITRKEFTTWLTKALKAAGVKGTKFKGHSL